MRKRPVICVTRKIPENGIKLLEKYFTVHLNTKDRNLTPYELLRNLNGAFAVVAMMANRFDKDCISQLESIRVISNFAVGYDNVDVKAATEKGIAVTNTPGVLTNATADLTFGLLLATARRIVEGDRLVREGRFTGWTPTMMLGNEVMGKTIGIIGAGRIGTAVAKRAAGFGMKILYNSEMRSEDMREIGAGFVGLKDLLMRSDFVSIHVPLNRTTRGLIGKKEIGLMKANGILLNTARGEVVDEDALIIALKEKKIAGAGLDVYCNEPNVNKRLFTLKNVVLAPHLGSATLETRAKMAEMAALNAIAVLRNEPPPAILNPEVLEKPRRFQ